MTQRRTATSSPQRQFAQLAASLADRGAPRSATHRALVGGLLGAAVLAVVATAWWLPQVKPSRDFSREPAPSDGTVAGFDTLRWAELIPAGWNPVPDASGLAGLATVSDRDPRAQTAWRALRQSLDAAPTEPALHGRAVRIPGYVVPLDGRLGGRAGGRTDAPREFLLVPYFGACIHTPPPPANQVIHVTAPAALAAVKTMDAVWVRGTLAVARRDSSVATSGYTLAAVAIETEKAR